MYITKINRRDLLTTAGIGMALGSCKSSTPASCLYASNAIDQASCRQENQFNDLPLRLTAGMIVGAAIGAGIAIAFKFNPVVGAIGGAMAAGGAIAADTYIQYLKEQNDNNLTRMNKMAHEHLVADVSNAKETLIDTKTSFKTAREAFSARDGLLIKHARDISTAEKTLHYVKKNTKALTTAHVIYRDVSNKDVVLNDTAGIANNKELKYYIDQIEAEERRFFGMLG